MNKYIGILALLALMSTEAQAQVLDTSVSVEVEKEVITQVVEAPVVAPMTTAEKVMQAEARLKAQREELAPMDARTRREEALMQLRTNTSSSMMRAEEPVAEPQVAQTKEASKENLRIRIADLRLSIVAEQDEARIEMLEARIKAREVVVQKLEEMLSRIKDQSERVTIQIEKMNKRGVNTEEAERFITEANSKLALAGVKVIEAETILALSIEELTEESKEVLQGVINSINTSSREANAELVKSARALRDSLVAKLKATAGLKN